jgi:glycine cleavage system H protein
MSLHFTGEHEWIRLENGIATIGISDHAQQALGDIVFAEAPEGGRTLNKGDEAAVVESVKAASDIYAPCAGEVWRAIRRLPTIPRSSTAIRKAKAGFSR